MNIVIQVHYVIYWIAFIVSLYIFLVALIRIFK